MMNAIQAGSSITSGPYSDTLLYPSQNAVLGQYNPNTVVGVMETKVIFSANIRVIKADNGYIVDFGKSFKVATSIEEVRNLLAAEMAAQRLES